jgi:hypothetical protein
MVRVRLRPPPISPALSLCSQISLKNRDIRPELLKSQPHAADGRGPTLTHEQVSAIAAYVWSLSH